MEGIHRRWRAEVLVQYREQAEHMGDARGLQECAGTGSPCSSSPSCVSLVLENPCPAYTNAIEVVPLS
jgi:hypothetical protein